MIPPNIVAAAAEGQMLGLIFFSLLFGFFMTRISAPYSEIVGDFWQGIFEIMLLITDWVMKFAPIGVLALVAKVVATTGVEIFIPLLSFTLTVLAALATHLFLVLPLLLSVVGRVNPIRQYQAMAPRVTQGLLHSVIARDIADYPRLC